LTHVGKSVSTPLTRNVIHARLTVKYTISDIANTGSQFKNTILGFLKYDENRLLLLAPYVRALKYRDNTERAHENNKTAIILIAS
jgi:hypothetical protein